MLYTVIPLEKIYATPNNNEMNRKDKQKEVTDAEFRDVLLPHGRIVTRREGENYVIERLNSTDMNDYLKDDYVPGKSIKNI